MKFKRSSYSIIGTILVVGMISLGSIFILQLTVLNETNKETKAMVITKNNFEDVVIKSDKPVMIDFWATWCPPCNAMTPVVESLAKKMEGIAVIGKINTSEEQELAMTYEIASIPTFKFFKDGKVRNDLTLVGIQSEAKLEANLRLLAAEE